jgi:hypothetical protein
VEVGELGGITSVIALAEVAHRLMILEAIRTHGLKPNPAVKKLREFVQLVNNSPTNRPRLVYLAREWSGLTTTKLSAAAALGRVDD